MTKNQHSGVKKTKFGKMLLHFLTPNIEAGKEDDHHAAAAAMKILPGQWIEAIIGAVEVWETEKAAVQA